MVLGLLKWLNETRFYERKKTIIIKTWILDERKVHIKKKGRVYEFLEKGKSWYHRFLRIKGDLFQNRKLVERWSFPAFYETCTMF